MEGLMEERLTDRWRNRLKDSVKNIGRGILKHRGILNLTE